MHIKKIELHRFKRFEKATINLKDNLSLVVGGNNSGKSSVLQALATWQFCKTLLEIEKGRKAWILTERMQGIGMGIVDFTPMHVPSLSHLWTNLKSQKSKEADGYTLKIKVFWDACTGEEKYLEIGMSLANDRLFIKTTETNLTLDEVLDIDGQPIEGNVPRIAYLPPFAGITDRETRLTPAMRERLIGQGLSGGVIRNALFDLYNINREQRNKLGEGRSKIKNSDLALLRESDSWEILQKTMQKIFGTELKTIPFNERYHSYLKIECVKGQFENNKFTKFKNYNSRDLMVEGSGFLQWLSVYTLMLSPELDVILLDEPDAHLHPSLQQQLVNQLGKISSEKEKQVLLATHSTELIRSYEHDKILALRDGKGKYLSKQADKVGILAGIGAVHTPTLHSLIQHKRMLILEAESDSRFIQLLSKQAGIKWPENLVLWHWTGKVNERRQLFLQLKKDIPDLKAISIRDRDDEADKSVCNDLVDKSFKITKDFTALKWRRRHIENYLFSPEVIARSTQKTVLEIKDFFSEKHGLALPDDVTATDVVPAVRDARGKEIMTEGRNSVLRTFKVKREDVAKNMTFGEIPEDIKTFLKAIQVLCSN